MPWSMHLVVVVVVVVAAAVAATVSYSSSLFFSSSFLVFLLSAASLMDIGHAVQLAYIAPIWSAVYSVFLKTRFSTCRKVMMIH